MRGPVPPERFARQVGIAAERIEEYRSAGLVDPDGDGLLDAFDALRVAILGSFEDRGVPAEQLAEELKKPGNELLTRRLFPLEAKTFTPEEAAERTGLTVEQLEELATAMGFAPGSPLYKSDVEAIGRSQTFLALGLPWAALIEGARVYGDALRRMTQADINLTHRFVCEVMAQAGANEKDISVRFYEVGPMLTETAEHVIAHVHGDLLVRALADHALQHLEAAQTSELPGTTEATILFVDLALFTSLAQAHGDELAAVVLDRFDSIVRRHAIEREGTVIKQLGDAFMLIFQDAEDAVRFAGDLLHAAAREDDFPALRFGIHSGPVLYRVGDYVGTTVNVASRVTSMAMPNVALMTEPVAVAAREAGMEVEEIGARRARGVGDPITLYRLASEREVMRDPVCGTVVGQRAAGSVLHDGREVRFCSQNCLRSFLAEPERFAANVE